MELISMRMKAKRALNVLDETQALEEKKAKLEVTIGGESMPIPQDMPILAKVVNLSDKKARILRISSSDSLEVVTQTVTADLGRAAQLSLRIGREVGELNQERLSTAIGAVVRGDESAVVIVAA
jgi:hypothetical protein